MKTLIAIALALLVVVIPVLIMDNYLVGAPQTPEPRPMSLLVHSQKAIELSAPNLSVVRKKLIATMIAGIAESTFATRDHAEWWITLLGIESRYDGRARSPTGAVGIGQLIPSYREDFGKACGLTEVNKEDLADDYVNATLSACYFRTMIEKNDGSIPLALISYNAGLHSKDLQRAKSGTAPGIEPSAYTTRAVIHKEQVDK